MVAAYPGSIRSFTEQVDGVDVVDASDVNDLYEEVRAIQVELGTSPSGASATVKDFLTTLNSTKYGSGSAIRAASGTLSAAGLGFSAEANLGLFRPVAGAVAITTAGVERARADASGLSAANMTVTTQLTASAAANFTGATVTGLDHGASIGGLGDDDHPHYLNAARHDARDHTAALASSSLADLGTRALADVTGHTASVHNALVLDHSSLNATSLSADDHIQYLTTTRHTALTGSHVTNGNTHDHVGGDGGTVDHGNLAGLTGDDHTQYLTTTRHTNLSGAHVTNGDSHNHSGGDGGSVDHGALGGLTGDDHSAVYANHNLNETITGNWNFSNRVRSKGNYVVRSSVGGYIHVSSGGPSGGTNGDIWLEW